jgi:autotransporter-associated beta strand protein
MKRVGLTLIFCGIGISIVVGIGWYPENASGAAVTDSRFDWRTANGVSHNFVSPVRDQGGHGCTIYSHVAVAEAWYKITRGDTTNVWCGASQSSNATSSTGLSEQTEPDLLGADYYNTPGNFTDMVNPNNPSDNRHGLLTRHDLPWQASGNPDQPQPGWTIPTADMNRRFFITSCTTGMSPPGSAQTKALLLANGPVPVGIDCSCNYVSNFNNTPIPGYGHSVMITGWKNDASNPAWGGGYFIVKNSSPSSGGELGGGYYEVPYAVLDQPHPDGRSTDGRVNDMVTGPAYFNGSLSSATWTNGSGNNIWNTSSGNWSHTGGTWGQGEVTNGWLNGETAATFSWTGATTIAVDANSHISAYGITVAAGSNYTFAGGPLIITGYHNDPTVAGGGINARASVTFNNSQITVGAPSTWTVNSGQTLTVNSPVDLHINTLTVDGPGTTNLNGVVSDVATNSTFGGLLTGYKGSLTKTGAGVLTLSGANTYTGPTVVAAGTLNVGNVTGSATGSGGVSVHSGAVLTGSGIINGPVAVAGTLSPGSSLGALTVNDQVTFQEGSTFSVDVNGLTAGSEYDQLITTGPVSLAGTLTLSFAGFTPTGHDVLFLIDNLGLGPTTGMFQYADNSLIGAFDGYDWYITYDANHGVSPNLNGGNDTAIYSFAVPEPASLILLSIGLLGLLVYVWTHTGSNGGYCVFHSRARHCPQNSLGRCEMRLQTVALVTAIILAAGLARADVFSMPAGQKSFEFVTVGDPGNAGEQSRLFSAGDPTHYGAVGYSYQIGKYDVTTAQYCQFLNAVAKTDTYGLYNPIMGGGDYYPMVVITRSGSSGSYNYSVAGGYSEATNCPIFGVTWGDAARFCNWLQNGQPVGDQGAGTTETGAYTLDGAITNSAFMTVSRNAGATYVIPSENEWYKAAFYKGGGTDAGYWLYPTRSDTAPSNVLSATGTNNANFYDDGYTDPTNLLTPVGAFAASPGPYGTYDMGGDVWQWNEADIGSNARGLRNGDSHLDSDHLASYYRSYNSPPADGWSTVGFRVASVPEPSSIAMLLAIAAGMLIWRRTRTFCH